MDHDYESRQWAESRPHFTAFVTGFVRQIGAAFEVLTARLYEAPWDKRQPSISRRGAR